MTTTAGDRDILRAWRDTHDDVQPDRDGHACVKFVWVDGRCAGQCGQTSQWIVDYKPRTGLLGKRAYCEPHTVELIRKWTDFENGKVPQ